MTRKRGDKPTPAQHRATQNNNCLRTLAALERAFTLAGHPDFAVRVSNIAGMFRSYLK